MYTFLKEVPSFGILLNDWWFDYWFTAHSSPLWSDTLLLSHFYVLFSSDTLFVTHGLSLESGLPCHYSLSLWHGVLDHKITPSVYAQPLYTRDEPLLSSRVTSRTGLYSLPKNLFHCVLYSILSIIVPLHPLPILSLSLPLRSPTSDFEVRHSLPSSSSNYNIFLTFWTFLYFSVQQRISQLFLETTHSIGYIFEGFSTELFTGVCTTEFPCL